MRILSNKNGIALIILLAAIVFISALGAGFVSIMGTKHRSIIYPNNSYKALNIANAGMEYAIRYISDGLSDAESDYYTYLIVPSNISFAGGRFNVGRNLSDNSISVTAEYPYPSPISTHIVKLSNFRNYISPIVLNESDPFRFPRRFPPGTNNIRIPIIFNAPEPISFINIEFDIGVLYLQYIRLEDGTTLFDYTKDITGSQYCYNGKSGRECKEKKSNGLTLPLNDLIRLDSSIPVSPTGNAILMSFESLSSNVTFNVSYYNGVQSQIGKTSFKIP